MEKIKQHYKNLLAALATFHETLEKYSKLLKKYEFTKEDQESIHRMMRDSLIQRFEYCVDTLSKYLQLYLEEVEKKSLERKSPRAIFRYCHQVGILSEDETTRVMEMVECRNKTSHLYQEEIADFVAKLAPEHYELMKKIILKTNI